MKTTSSLQTRTREISALPDACPAFLTGTIWKLRAEEKKRNNESVCRIGVEIPTEANSLCPGQG